MVDPKRLRAEPEALKKAYQDRGGRYVPALEQALSVSTKHLETLKAVEALRAQQNALSAEFARAKKDNAPVDGIKQRADAAKASMADLEGELKTLESATEELLLGLPNPPHESVPVGKSEADNPVVRKGPEPAAPAFKARDHHELGEILGILDLETAAKLSGSRFPLIKGRGATLERAIQQFMLDLHTREHGYMEVLPPLLVTAQTLIGTGQLPKFEEDQYKTAPDNMYLVPTAEVPLTNLVRDSILEETQLPIQMTAGTACFRREAGSYGKDTRGLIRNHQFNKVELVWITKPEDSFATLEKLTAHAEEVLKRLGVPYRVIELCTADIGFSAAKTYDLEVWMPGEGRYREISSCSNCTDFQARRMNARFRRGPKGKTEFVHTLNGSGVAVGRIFAAVLENYQQADGSVVVPEPLRRYTGFDSIPVPAKA